MNLQEWKTLFQNNIDEAIEESLNYWKEIADLSKMNYSEVEIGDLQKKTMIYEDSVQRPVYQDVNIEIIAKEGYAIFIDFTSSTNYFTNNSNYTLFILVNAFNMIIKEYIKTHFHNAYFLEHTGDGAFLFIEDDIFDADYLSFLYMAEKLKQFAEHKSLLKINKNNFSLIHIGSSLGKGYLVAFGYEKRFVSSATWQAASNCKNASRIFNPSNPFKDYNFYNYLFKNGNFDNNYNIALIENYIDSHDNLCSVIVKNNIEKTYTYPVIIK